MQMPLLTSKIGLPKMLITMDMFGEPLPTFNIKGESDVRTHCGGCLSIIIIYIMILFATLKMQHLLLKHNPSVNIFTERDAFDETHVWYYNDQVDFMMAFAATQLWEARNVKNDTAFVKWFAHYYIQKEGEWTYEEIPMHKCSKEEMSQFYQPSKDSMVTVKKLKEANAFMCLDLRDLELYG